MTFKFPNCKMIIQQSEVVEAQANIFKEVVVHILSSYVVQYLYSLVGSDVQ